MKKVVKHFHQHDGQGQSYSKLRLGLVKEEGHLHQDQQAENNDYGVWGRSHNT